MSLPKDHMRAIDLKVERMVSQYRHEQDMAQIHKLLEWIGDRFPVRSRRLERLPRVRHDMRQHAKQ